LSRGFDEAGYPATPPVSYQLNRQLAGWNPPPQVFRAFGAHQRKPTFATPPVRTVKETSAWPVYLQKRKVGDDRLRS
jgi:hypothetical protein